MNGGFAFSGVPLHAGLGDTLEEHIKHFRYAYARDNNQAQGSSPPPRSMPVSVLPDPMEAMFHAAFTERGSSGARPTGRRWVAALDAVRSRLKKCGASSMHVFPNHLTTCPWCTLEQQGVVYFLDLGTAFTAAPSGGGFVLARVWAMIEQVPPPAAPGLPTVPNFSPKPKPLPSNIPSADTILFNQAVVVLLATVIVVGAAPEMWFFAVICAIGACGMVGTVGSEQRRSERKLWQAALDWAQQEYDQVLAQLKQLEPDGFHQKRQELAHLRDAYANLAKSERAALDDMEATAHQRQMHQFLDRCSSTRRRSKGSGRHARRRCGRSASRRQPMSSAIESSRSWASADG